MLVSSFAHIQLFTLLDSSFSGKTLFGADSFTACMALRCNK